MSELRCIEMVIIIFKDYLRQTQYSVSQHTKEKAWLTKTLISLKSIFFWKKKITC